MFILQMNNNYNLLKYVFITRRPRRFAMCLFSTVTVNSAVFYNKIGKRFSKSIIA